MAFNSTICSRPAASTGSSTPRWRAASRSALVSLAPFLSGVSIEREIADLFGIAGTVTASSPHPRPVVRHVLTVSTIRCRPDRDRRAGCRPFSPPGRSALEQRLRGRRQRARMRVRCGRCDADHSRPGRIRYAGWRAAHPAHEGTASLLLPPGQGLEGLAHARATCVARDALGRTDRSAGVQALEACDPCARYVVLNRGVQRLP